MIVKSKITDYIVPFNTVGHIVDLEENYSKEVILVVKWVGVEKPVSIHPKFVIKLGDRNET